MDAFDNYWYYSSMSDVNQIPAFSLYGECEALPDVVHFERVRDRAEPHDWVISPHRHDQIAQVISLVHGAARFSIDGRSGHLESGEYLYIPRGFVHSFRFLEETEGIVLSIPSFNIGGPGPSNAALVEWLSVPHLGPSSKVLTTMMEWVAEAYWSSGTFRAQRLISLVYCFFATAAEKGSSEANATEEAILRIQQLDVLISAHLADGWSARKYADALHITAGHLNRVIRKTRGVTLTKYLETATMTEASRLLAFTTLTMAEIAYRLGYRDPSYFSRRFRANLGLSPTEYRSITH